MRIITFDTEATDLVPGQICQISYLIHEDGKTAGKNYWFSVDEMSEGAYEVHGMSLDDLDELSGGERFEDRAEELYEDFSSAGMWIGHNVAADDRYLRVEMERCGKKLRRINTFCTMNYFGGIMNMKRKVATGRPKPPRLEELAEWYELTPERIAERADEWFGGGGAAHDSRYDTAATWMCVLAASARGDVRGIV